MAQVSFQAVFLLDTLMNKMLFSIPRVQIISAPRMVKWFFL
ncbi:hypothetical protein PAUR_a2201 [Pseudoalteromonas aurantia 208]|uniref:Orphan protein n=1 Tax=Pseudoalteromonas aurantia 208 TaxID=1314867 RepID=A0ABR9EC70_9GAMM|nr:hypothetical protein [Pseudoalteromonas aurantia 208]